MVNLNIKYSLEDEILRVKYTIDKIDWFKEKGYKVKLPEILSLGNSDLSPEEIESAIVGEYDEENYKVEEKYVLKTLPKIKEVLKNYFNSTSLEPQSSYEINLTRYGVGGSYHLPNKIIANIQTCSEMKLVRTIVHEIIHLSIEELIQKYDVDHWSKERLVDLILENIDSEINTMQKISVDTSSVDSAFEKKYPDIEEIIKSI